MDTIYAVSSGAPPAAIAVLRISGPHALTAATALAGHLPPARRASLRHLTDPADGTTLDRALVVVFPGPATATGEDIVELHLHGGRAVVAAVEAALAEVDGLRAALPGEFTRRALLAGIIDLTEAEGLGDLLAAETETQRRAAMAATEGGIRRQIDDWLNRILALGAAVEAQLDFSDEDDVADADEGKTAIACAVLAADMYRVAATPPVERLKDGVRIVLAGPPNSGKSTLLNAMAERDVAIVSPIAGTTRDRIEASISRDGIAYLLIDTAGLTDTDDTIEAIGVRRAQEAIEAADIVLWLGDDEPPAGMLWLYPRIDQFDRTPPDDRRLGISGRTGQGIDSLWQEIARSAVLLLPKIDQIAMNRRQRDLVLTCAGYLDAIDQEQDMLIVAEALRMARSKLDEVTGLGSTDAMLDALFGRFCIGK